MISGDFTLRLSTRVYGQTFVIEPEHLDAFLRQAIGDVVDRWNMERDLTGESGRRAIERRLATYSLHD